MQKIDWKRKLTSRKFWMAVALFISGVVTATGHSDKAETVSGLIMQGAAVVAYIIGEGLTDTQGCLPEIEQEIEYEDEEEDA